MKSLLQSKHLAAFIILLLFNSHSFSQLSGTYTIGTGGNYLTMNAAVSALVANGVNGPVTFNIKSGNYNEQVTIDSVRGVSSINTVTFKSETGNASDVKLYFKTTSDVFNVTINRVDFLKFKHITFIDSNNSYTKILQLLNVCDNISFENNIFICEFFIPTTAIISSSNGRNLIFRENFFSSSAGGALGWIRGGIILNGFSKGCEISGNTFSGFTNTLTLTNQDSVIIEKNYILCGRNEMTNSCGISISSCNVTKILKNNIHSDYSCGPSQTPGSSLIMNNCVNSLIANNFFKFGGCTSISLSTCSNVGFYYNTMAFGNNDFPTDIAIGNNNSLLFMNNIYVNSNNFRPGFIYNFSNSTFTSNFNNFYLYYPTQNLGRYNGVDIPNLPAWISATGNDPNSGTRTVSFISISDLHLAGASLNDEGLKGIPISQVTDDIDGNPRDPLLPTMGADEPSFPVNITVNLTMLIEGFYEDLTDTQVPDTVRAYLRTSTTPYSVTDSAITKLSSNGTGTLRFFNAPAGAYYLEVSHRNSINTWSKTAIDSLAPGNESLYDFTTSISQAFGDNLVLKGTKYCIYSGDVNKDGVIDGSDTQLIDNAAFNFVSGYVSTDTDGNSFVDGSDALIADNNAFNFVGVTRP